MSLCVDRTRVKSADESYSPNSCDFSFNEIDSEVTRAEVICLNKIANYAMNAKTDPVAKATFTVLERWQREGVFNEPEKAYLIVIQNFLENKLLDKAQKVYKRAKAAGIWLNNEQIRFQAKQLLKQGVR